VWPVELAGGVAVAGSKRPLAVLLHDGSTLRAFDPAGHPMSPAWVEVLHPGAAGMLAALWQQERDAAFSGEPD